MIWLKVWLGMMALLFASWLKASFPPHCQICDSTFDDPDGLFAHMQRSHHIE